MPTVSGHVNDSPARSSEPSIFQLRRVPKHSILSGAPGPSGANSRREQKSFLAPWRPQAPSMSFQTSGAARAVVRNFRKIAAAHKGRLILRYFTKNTLEPIYPPALDGAGRTLEKGDAS